MTYDFINISPATASVIPTALIGAGTGKALITVPTSLKPKPKPCLNSLRPNVLLLNFFKPRKSPIIFIDYKNIILLFYFINLNATIKTTY